MDPLTRLLDGPRARRAFALRVVMAPGWSIDVRDRAPVTVAAVITGTMCLVADGLRWHLGPGDVAVVRGPDRYTMTDDATRPADVIIHPGQLCTTPSGEDLQLSMLHGVRTWGNAADGATTMLVGTYETDAEVGATVAAALPRIAVVPAGQVDLALLELLERETMNDEAGHGSSFDRLLDVLLIHAVRAWARLNPDAARGWLAADPLVARTLELFHGSPAESWSLASLALRLNASRASIAGRFRASVGEPPMTYLTNWRMLLASEFLADRNRTVADVAAEVGYGSPFALSTAFKRRFGTSPTEYRQKGREVAS